MNIIQLLQDHLPSAIEDLDDEITKAYNTISLLESRRLQLQRIANAAGITVRESAPSRLKDQGLNGTESNAR